MLRAVIGGFLIGPVVLVVAALVLSKAGLLATVTIGVLFGALFVAVLAGAATGAAVRGPRSVVVPTEPAPLPPLIGDATLTSTPTPVKATARENLASTNPWRRHFTGWRYGKGRDMPPNG